MTQKFFPHLSYNTLRLTVVMFTGSKCGAKIYTVAQTINKAVILSSNLKVLAIVSMVRFFACAHNKVIPHVEGDDTTKHSY